MAGSRSKSTSRSQKGAGDHAREAVAEWKDALRHGTAALAPVAQSARSAVTRKLNPLSGQEEGSDSKKKGSGKKKGSTGKEKGSVGKKLNPTETEKGGRVGDAADALLAKLGKPGKLASKASLGSRAVERLTPNIGIGNGNGASGRTAPLPIQESIEISVPVRVAWALATRPEDYPEFLDRVSGGERNGDGASFDAKVHGIEREVEVEVLEEQEERRLAWKASGGHDHTGVASFHELAPGLTHVELSVVLDSEGLVQRVARTTHLTQHAIRGDLHRFKAYAELWQEEEELDEPEAASADEEEPEDAHEDDELPEDEEDEDEEPEDEYDGEEPEHAYSDAIEDYESEDAYA